MPGEGHMPNRKPMNTRAPRAQAKQYAKPNKGTLPKTLLDNKEHKEQRKREAVTKADRH